MSSKDHILVKISKEQIRTQLKKMLGSEHCDLISQVIIDNLSETEVGLTQLYKAFSGLKDQLKYKAGQVVWVKVSTLYSWRIEKDKMVQAGMIHQDQVMALITEINETKLLPYKIKYAYIGGGGSQEEDQMEVAEEALNPYDGYPMNQ